MLTLIPAQSVSPPIVVAEEQAQDQRAREALLDEAFGSGRFGKTSQRLREGRLPVRGLALVAREGCELVGTLRCWSIDAGGVPALLLGPVAVARTHRSRGIGAKLMRAALRRSADAGHKAVLLVGDASYYARFGFEAALTEKLGLPGPVDRERLLGLEIEVGALSHASGMVVASGERGAVRRRLRQALTKAA
jgi:predicted N-acetyltransferase YhbS